MQARPQRYSTPHGRSLSKLYSGKENASDSGAFSFHPDYDSDKLRSIIQGLEFRTTRVFARETRNADEWSAAFLVGIHREVFGSLFQSQAGNYRISDAIFGRRAAPPYPTIDVLMGQLVPQIQDHLRLVHSEADPLKQMDLAFTFAAIDHAEMLRIHPFVDGNGRWARIATVLFLFDSGLPVGTIVRTRDKRAYIDAADRCIDNAEPGDLANLFVREYNEILKSRITKPLGI